MKRTDKLILAPMAGVTDSVFRRICHEHGCSTSVTEMVSAKGMYYKSRDSFELIEINPELEGDVRIQIFGSDPEIMGKVTAQLESSPCTGIDINMGCPVPKVFRNGEGSALLLNKELAMRIVESVKKNTTKPVSIKMRIGIARCTKEDGTTDYSKNLYDYVSFAKAMEEAGADELAVHARTREDYYSGKADWVAIKKIKETLKIPVIGNGDARSYEDAERMMAETGCDAVMIGRGSMGNPWVFENRKPAKEELLETINHHLDLSVEKYGEKKAVLQARSQISWYTKGIRGASLVRNRINCAASRNELREILKEI